MNIVVLCSAFLVIFYAALSVNVSRVRLQGRDTPRVTEAQLTHAIRAHGNAAEYIPLIVAVLLYLDSVAPGTVLDIIAVVAVLSRVAHAAAMLLVADVGRRQRLRFIGALGTYASLFALGGALLHSTL